MKRNNDESLLLCDLPTCYPVSYAQIDAIQYALVVD